jgi:hypothetical protein
MSFYRSDSVGHYDIFIPRESAWDIMNKLGIDISDSRAI